MIESKRSIIYRIVIYLQIKHLAFVCVATKTTIFESLMAGLINGGVKSGNIQVSIRNTIQH